MRPQNDVDSFGTSYNIGTNKETYIMQNTTL